MSTDACSKLVQADFRSTVIEPLAPKQATASAPSTKQTVSEICLSAGRLMSYPGRSYG